MLCIARKIANHGMLLCVIVLVALSVAVEICTRTFVRGTGQPHALMVSPEHAYSLVTEWDILEATESLDITTKEMEARLGKTHHSIGPVVVLRDLLKDPSTPPGHKAVYYYEWLKARDLYLFRRSNSGTEK